MRPEPLKTDMTAFLAWRRAAHCPELRHAGSGRAGELKTYWTEPRSASGYGNCSARTVQAGVVGCDSASSCRRVDRCDRQLEDADSLSVRCTTLFAGRAELFAAEIDTRCTCGLAPHSALPARTARMAGDDGGIMSCRTISLGAAAAVA